jgi:hypothetical protein
MRLGTERAGSPCKRRGTALTQIATSVLSSRSRIVRPSFLQCESIRNSEIAPTISIPWEVRTTSSVSLIATTKRRPADQLIFNGHRNPLRRRFSRLNVDFLAADLGVGLAGDNRRIVADSGSTNTVFLPNTIEGYSRADTTAPRFDRVGLVVLLASSRNRDMMQWQKLDRWLRVLGPFSRSVDERVSVREYTFSLRLLIRSRSRSAWLVRPQLCRT